jgi:hypothetical protein
MSLGGASYETLDGRTFNNQGAVNCLAYSFNFNVEDGALFNNETGATFTASAALGIDGGSGSSGTFANAGTFTSSAGSGNTTQVANVLFNNTGTVNVNSGTLLLNGGGNDSKGTFIVPAGSTLEFGGGVTALNSAIGSSTNKAAGTLAFSGGTTTVSGAIFATGNFTIDISGGNGLVSGGIADFEKNISVPYLILTGSGVLTGPGAVTVTATTGTALTWNHIATMSGTGSTTLAKGATMSLGDPTENVQVQTLDGRTFNNHGTIDWQGLTNFILSLDDGAPFNNDIGGTINAGASEALAILESTTPGSSGTFINAGTFNSVGGGSIIAVSLNNTGTVNVNSELELEGGGTSTGTFAFNFGNTVLGFYSGFYNLNSSTTSVGGAGVVDIAYGGTVWFGGSYNITGLTSIREQGTVYFLNGGSTGSFMNYVDANSTGVGTVYFASGTTFTVNTGNYTQSGAGASTYLNGATLAVSSGNEVDIEASTNLYGPGTIIGNLANAGSVYVGGGTAPGTLTVNGNYTQTGLGFMYVQIDGSGAGQYDQLVLTGTASLTGTLQITLGGGYSSPPSGTPFTIMTYASDVGDFSTKNLDGLNSASPGLTTYVVTA